MMVEGLFHVYMEFSLVTSKLEKLCQQTEKTLADGNYTEVTVLCAVSTDASV